MSENEGRSVPSRGRSSVRGGRGGISRGGPRGGRKVNGTANDAAAVEESLEEQGEIGELKKKYSSQLSVIRDIYPDWTDTDLVLALEEAGGDADAAVDKISQGAISQFAEVKKPKDRARSKVPAEPTTAGASDRPPFSTRGARGRGGFEGARGGRGRAVDRGRGGFRGGRGGHATTNGVDKDASAASVPTTESSAWDTPATTEAAGAWDNTPAEPIKNTADSGDGVLGTVTAIDPPPAASTQPAKSSVIEQGGAKKSWASMFAKPKPAPAPVPQKQILARQPQPVELDATEQALPEPAQAATEFAEETTAELEEVVEAAAPAEPQPVESAAITETATAPVQRPATSESEGLTLTPSKDPLTEENVEHLPDESNPPATQTVASTAGSIDPRNLTPAPTQQAPIGRPPVGGYATVAARSLTGAGGRSASFQRRVQEQQEAVVMPGHNAVDRAAVQFGSMGLNGEAGPDVDEEREEPETRHAPQHSPPAQPRTSLPPAPRQASATQEPVLPEAQPQAASVQAQPTPKQAPGLPPASVQNQQQIQDPSLGQAPSQDQQYHQGYNQYGRGYGQPQSLPGGQQDNGAQQQQQKPYDPFSHQAQHSQYDQYGQPQQHHQQAQHQSGFGGLSSAPGDFSSYYTSDAPRNNNYQQYYGGSYGAGQDSRQQAGQPQSHDPTIGQQRSASGYGAGANDNAFASQGHQQAQSRFAEAPGSGHNTPNPVAASQQQPSQSAQGQQSLHQQQQPSHGIPHGGFPSQQAAAAAGYPYGHPYYPSAYPQAYANQFQGYGQQYGGGSGYGAAQGGYQGKQQQQSQPQASSYGAPHSYGSSYDQHSSSPANVHAYGQNQRSASGMGASLGGLDEYGRSSAQPGSHQQNSGFGGTHDPFARSTSGFGAQSGYGQQNISGQEDSLKAFDNAKSGPSPSLGQPGRPGSAANSAVGNAQSGLPPPQQAQHGGFGGGYPGFQGQGSYNSLGGLGGHQAQQGQQGQQSYGYGGGFNQTYGGYGQQTRGGWGQNYTSQ